MLIVGGFLLFGVGNLFYFAIQPLRGCRYIALVFPALYVGLFRFNPFRIALRQLVVPYYSRIKASCTTFYCYLKPLRASVRLATGVIRGNQEG